MTIAKRLRYAMKHSGITTEAELHRASGINQPTIHRILSGESKSPRHTNIEALAHALGVSPYWLLLGDDLKSSQIKSVNNPLEGGANAPLSQSVVDELHFEGRFESSDSSTPLGEGEVEVPLYREVETLAGSGTTQVIESKGETRTFPKSTLRRAGVLFENAACASVAGNSMEPVLPHGATVGVNTADKKIVDGKLFAIDHGGMLRVKLLFRVPGGGIRLVSYNKTEHPAEDYDQEYMAKNIRIIGRVFWYESFV